MLTTRKQPLGGCDAPIPDHGSRFAAVLGLLLALVCARAPAHAEPADAEPVREIEIGGVLLAGGAPCTRARVELAPLPDNHARAAALLAGSRGPEPDSTTEPDQEGLFRLRSPRAGIWTLRVLAEGRVAMRRAPFAVLDAIVVPPLTLLPDVGTRIRVEAADGSGAAGVWVYGRSATPEMWRESRADGWRPAARLALTDERGEAVLPRARGERLMVSAFQGGVLAAVEAEGEARIVLRLPPPGTVHTLRVLDRSGRPRAGVVVAYGALIWPLGRTGDDGRVTISRPSGASGELHLFSAEGGWISVALPEEAVSGAERSEEGPEDLVFDAPSRLTGRILDAATGRPLAGALIWPAYDPGRFTRSDRTGLYALPASATGRSDLFAQAPGRLRSAVLAQSAGRDGVAVPTVALAAERTLTGRVLSPDGKPLAGALVDAAQPRGAVRALGLTDDRGHFTIHGLVPGEAVDVTATHPGRAPAQRHGLRPSTRGVELVLEPQRTGFGRVLDAGEQPLPGVRVTARATSGPGATTEALTGSDGRFELPLPDVPGAPVDLEVVAPGFAPALVREIETPPGPGPADLGIVSLVPAAVIEGRVVDPRGMPVPDGRVRAVAEDGSSSREQAARLEGAPVLARSDAEGRFRIADLEPGRSYHLRISADGFLPRRLTGVEAPTTEIVGVELQPGARLAGRVKDEDGEPIPAARVTVRDPGSILGIVGLPGDLDRSLHAETDGDGRFTFEPLPRGLVELEVSAVGFQRPEPVRVEVSDSQEEVLVTLRRGAIVAGRVTNRDGEAVAGVRLRAGGVRGTSDAEGRFRLAGVELGRRVLVARHLEYDELVREIEVDAGTNEIDLTLEGGSPVAGLVVTEDGDPVVAARLSFHNDPRQGEIREYQALSADDGSFALRRMVDGSYDLEVDAEGYAPLVIEKAVRVAGEAVSDLRVVVTASTEVTGRLLGLRFEEIAAARVEAADGRVRRVGRIHHDGRYRITGLGAGIWRLHAWAPGDRGSEESLAVEPGERVLHRDLRFGGFTVTGRVGHGGEPVGEAKVVLIGRDVGDRRSGGTDWEGRFRIQDVEPGLYVLSVANPRALLQYEEEIEILGDRELTIEIATSSLSGRAVSSVDGSPLSDALVWLQRLTGRSETPGSLTTVGTDRQGGFRIVRMTAGVYQLRVERRGYRSWTQKVEVASGEVVEGLEVALDPAEGLVLNLHAVDGAPAFARVSATAPDGTLVLAGAYPVSPDGRLSLSSLPAGRWWLRLAAPGTAVTTVAVTVPGPPVDLVLESQADLQVRVPALLEENRTGSLAIRYPSGETFVGLDPGGEPRSTWHLLGGAGSVEGLPAGAWELTVTSDDGRLWQATVVARTGASTVISIP